MENHDGLSSLQKHIYHTMQEKETEELLEIWQENNREDWTDEAFQAIRAILLERLGEVPEQEPWEEIYQEDDAVHPGENIGLMRISTWASALSWIILGLGILLAVLRFIDFLTSSWQSLGMSTGQPWYLVLQYILNQIQNLLYAGFLFFMLQGLSAIMDLLMDIKDMMPVVGEANAQGSST